MSAFAQMKYEPQILCALKCAHETVILKQLPLHESALNAFYDASYATLPE